MIRASARELLRITPSWSPAAILGTAPDTVCQLCRDAELRPARRMLEQLQQPSTRAVLQASLGTVLAAYGPSWYEQHRDAWVATGDERELRRMLRHVR